jgi:hypothetical protein
LVAKVSARKSISLGWKYVDECNGDYIDGGLTAKIRQTILTGTLTL